MKLRKLLLIPILSLAVAGLTIVPALGGRCWSSLSPPISLSPHLPVKLPSLPCLLRTFSSEEIGNDAGIFWFGKNLLYAGNNVSVDQVSRGLLFAAGNNLKLNSQIRICLHRRQHCHFLTLPPKRISSPPAKQSPLPKTPKSVEMFCGCSNYLN